MVTKIQIAGKLKFYSKPYGRQWKWRYQIHGKMVEPKLKIPKGLENVKIIDPLRPEKVEPESKPKWMPPRRHPILESFFPQPTIKDHPDYKHEPIKLFNRETKFHAGIDQVCLLTKTKPVSGLPSVILNSYEKFKSDNQDSIVQNYIRQALAFNPTKEITPRLQIPHDPKFRIGAEYATPHLKQMNIILDNLIRLSNINVNRKNPNSVTDRLLVSENPLSTIVKRGDDLIQIRRNSDFVLYTQTKLKPIANDNEIKETVDYKLVDMYPIFPTIDLVDEHVYDLKNQHTIGWKSNETKFNNVQTFFHSNDDQLAPEIDVSRLIMFAFGYAYAQAQLLNQNNKLDLNENLQLKSPIVVNGVSISNERLNYVTYQLNTLNLVDNSGVKNIVYYDTNNELYFNRPTIEKLPYPTHKNIQRLALRHLEYNPDAFRKLLSLVAFGSSA